MDSLKEAFPIEIECKCGLKIQGFSNGFESEDDVVFSRIDMKHLQACVGTEFETRDGVANMERLEQGQWYVQEDVERSSQEKP